MPFECWEAFAKFAHSSIKLHYSSGEVNFEIYCEKLTNYVSEVIGEKRRTLLDADITHQGKVMYLESMISKIDLLFSNLFEDSSNGLRYLPDMFIITDDDNIEISSARRLRLNIINLGKEFRNEQYRFGNPQSLYNPHSKKRKRIPSRASFEIKKGKIVNLRRVHEILTNKEHPFIDDIPFDEFEKPFTGAPVTKKVNWLDVSALHYFIDEIHGKGIEKANEGQWVRASRCFTANKKEYTARQLNDACDPAASVTELLDKAIKHFL